MITISTSHFCRPDYTEQVLEALAAQPEAHECVYLGSLDESIHRPLIRDILWSHRYCFAEMELVDRPGPPSCNDNIKNALRMAQVKGAWFNIHLEDDVLPGKDFLAYMIEMATQFRKKKYIFTVSAWRHSEGWLPNLPHGKKTGYGTDQHFNCWGWGTWPDRLAEILANWTTGQDKDHDGDSGSWDHVVDRKIRGARYEVAPMISRAQNIGALNGTHRGDLILPHWINS